MCAFAKATTFIKLSFFFIFFSFFFLLSFSKTTIIEFAKIKSKDFVYKIKKRIKIDIANLFTHNFNLVAFLLFISTTTKLLDERRIFLEKNLTLINLFMTTINNDNDKSDDDNNAKTKRHVDNQDISNALI